MNIHRRKPQWEVIIKRPDYTKSTLTFKTVPEWSKVGSPTLTLQFVSSPEKLDPRSGYTDLIEYTYEESINNVSNPFSLKFVPSEDKSGLTWKDKIKARDLIYIVEFGKIRYIGVVKNTSYSSSIDNGEKPIRSISITGQSIGGMIASFDLPMNKFLWFNISNDAFQNNTKLEQALTQKAEDGQTLSELFSIISESFFSVVFASNTTGFAGVINKFFNLKVDVLKSFYPMNIRPFQEESNNLWSIFRGIVKQPVYELFGRFEEGKYNLICREAPFDYDNWDELTSTAIDPTYLISQNLGDSDDQVFTHYFSNMPNNAYTENEAYASNELNEISVFDNEKIPIFGYKQLKAEFPFFDIDKGRDEKSKDFLKNNSARLYAWYHNNVDFLSGEIVLMTVPKKGKEKKYINIGEKIKYLEGSNNSIEFYVESIKRKMEYPGMMTSSLSVTRGFEYGKTSVEIDGITMDTAQIRRISNQGRKLVDFEKSRTGANDK